jgi:cytoskeletal protein CcmA (bactofilin family)
MFSKTPSSPPQGPGAPTRVDPIAPPADTTPGGVRRTGQKLASLVANDMTIEGNITGGGELQIDGTIKGDVRVERVTIGETGQVDGGVYAEAVEVRGKISGSVTAKQVRLHGACHVDGDITHEQLAMETGAFFQGRSLRLQRPATQAAQPSVAAPAPPRPEPTTTPPVTTSSLTKDVSQTKDVGNGLGPKPASAPKAAAEPPPSPLWGGWSAQRAGWGSFDRP